MNIEKSITELSEAQNTIFKPLTGLCEKFAAQAKQTKTMMSYMNSISANTSHLQEALASLPNSISQFANLQLPSFDMSHIKNDFRWEALSDSAESEYERSHFSIKVQDVEVLSLINLQQALSWLRDLCVAENHVDEKTITVTIEYSNPQPLLWITKDTFIYFTADLFISEKLTNDKKTINQIANKCIEKMQEHGMEIFEVYTLEPNGFTGVIRSIKMSAADLKKIIIL